MESSLQNGQLEKTNSDGSGSPPEDVKDLRHQENSGVHADGYDQNLQGRSYNIGTEVSGEEELTLPVLYPEVVETEGIFSLEDLYSVVDPNTAGASVTEIATGNGWPNQLFPMDTTEAKSAEEKVLSAFRCPLSSYVGLILNKPTGFNFSGMPTEAANNVDNLAPENADGGNSTPSTESGSWDYGSGASGSQSAGVALESSQDSNAAFPAKVRRPRGRKPRTPAEKGKVAARTSPLTRAPVATVGQMLAAVQGRGEGNISTSNVPIRIKDNAAGLLMHATSSSDKSTYASLAPQEVSKMPPSLGLHRASIPYGRKFSIGGDNTTAAVGMGIASAIKCHLSQEQPGDVQPGSSAGMPTNLQGYNRVPHFQGDSLAASQNLGSHPVITIHHRPTAMVGDSMHIVGSKDLRQQPQRYSEQQNGPLEQLFSTRISNITGAPKRSTVAPTYIQQNMGLYTQLTAPKKQSDFESAKLTQEKWMQFPNPMQSYKSSGRSENQVPEFDATILQNIKTEEQQESPPTSAFPSGAANNNQLQFNFAPTDPTMHDMRHGVQNKFNSPSTTYQAFEEAEMSNYFFLPGVQGPVRLDHGHSRTSSSRLVSQTFAQIQELRSKLDAALFENRELKMKMQYLNKNFKLAAARSHYLYNQLEGINTFLQMQANDKKF